jgi:hypothetical protein
MFIKSVIITFIVTSTICSVPLTLNIIFIYLFNISKWNKLYKFNYIIVLFLINLIYVFLLNYLFVRVFTLPILLTMLFYLIYKKSHGHTHQKPNSKTSSISKK